MKKYVAFIDVDMASKEHLSSHEFQFMSKEQAETFIDESMDNINANFAKEILSDMGFVIVLEDIEESTGHIIMEFPFNKTAFGVVEELVEDEKWIKKVENALEA
jgi:hypothetical protein